MITEVSKAAVRLLVVDPASRRAEVFAFARFVELLGPGDVLVVNDAATLPASVEAKTAEGASIELRLFDGEGTKWRAVAFGAGDWRTKTEDRPPPPKILLGARLRFGALTARVAEVSTLSPRLLRLEFEASAEQVWADIYARGAPIQYAYRAQLAPLWSFQNAYATRPWAAENPSAGRPLSWEQLLAIRRRGAQVVALTHATGLSSTGDAAIDAALPLAERYEIPSSTADAVNAAVAAGHRVIAVGTSVMRALESAAQPSGKVTAGPGVAELLITEEHRPRVTHGLLTGIHSPQESHYRLLRSLVDEQTLEHATRTAQQFGLIEHEQGDAALLLAGASGDAAG